MTFMFTVIAGLDFFLFLSLPCLTRQSREISGTRFACPKMTLKWYVPPEGDRQERAAPSLHDGRNQKL